MSARDHSRRKFIVGGIGLGAFTAAAGYIGLDKSTEPRSKNTPGLWKSMGGSTDAISLYAVLFTDMKPARQTKVAFSEDSKTLLVARNGYFDGDGLDLQVWNLREQTSTMSTNLNWQGVTKYAVSSDASTVTGYSGLCPRIWLRSSGEEREVRSACGRYPNEIALNHDGKLMAATRYFVPQNSARRDFLDIWSSPHDTQPRSLAVTAPFSPGVMKFDRSGRLLAVASMIGEFDRAGSYPIITLIDATTGSVITTLDICQEEAGKQAKPIDDMDISENGSMLAVSVSDPLKNPTGDSAYGGVELWDLRTRTRLKSFTSNGGAVAMSRDGDMLAMGAFERFGVDIWSTSRMQPIASLNVSRAPGAGRGLNGSVVFSPDCTMLAVPVMQSVQLWTVGGF
ncbi:hypothetical protein [Nocardia sp. NPDC004860]|uniref:WD40 repeat domain-containing protein n=1 Tax=Nocardia sp. NPDC004860 TaxID=3154557 RepID=UPI0033B37A18